MAIGNQLTFRRGERNKKPGNCVPPQCAQGSIEKGKRVIRNINRWKESRHNVSSFRFPRLVSYDDDKLASGYNFSSFFNDYAFSSCEPTIALCNFDQKPVKKISTKSSTWPRNKNCTSIRSHSLRKAMVKFFFLNNFSRETRIDKTQKSKI